MSLTSPMALQAIRDGAALVRHLLGDDDDERAFLDSLECVVDVEDAIGALIKRSREREAGAAAKRALARAYEAGAARDDDAVAASARALGLILDAMGRDRVPHPLGLVAYRKGRLSVDVTDADAIPTQLCAVKTTRQPDKVAIRKQIEAGVDVPGARLVRGEDKVEVR